MANFEIFLNQIIILTLLIAGGYLAVRFKVLKDEDRYSLSRLILNITLPLLIFTTFSKMEMNGELLKNSLFAILLAVFAMGGTLLISMLQFKVAGVNKNQSAVSVLHSAFGNIVFLGFPLCNALLPDGKGLFFAAIFHLATDGMLWTVGIYLLNRHSHLQTESLLKHFINPNTIAFAVGIFMMSTGLKLPSVMHTAMNGLGHTTIYLSMLYVGILISSLHPGKIFEYRQIWIVSLNKLLLMPLLVYLIFMLFTKVFGFTPDHEALLIVFMQSSMPCMTTVAVLAPKFGYDDRPPALNAVFTMLISLITMPIVFFLFQRI